MAFRYEKNLQGNQDLVIDGFEKGIAPSPYTGISNIRNLDTAYYPGVAYVNYRRQNATISMGSYTFTGSLLANATSGTLTANWPFSTGSFTITFSNGDIRTGTFTNASTSVTWTGGLSGTATATITVNPITTNAMANPVQKAVSPAGLIYILDESGQIWKQSAVNSTTWNILGSGTGRVAMGAKGLAYFNNYLVVFGSSLVEYCGDGTGDSGIVSTNWNIHAGIATNSFTYTTNFAAHPTRLQLSLTYWPVSFNVNDPVKVSTTGAAPSPLVVGTTYYIVSVDQTNFFIEISATVGGSAINLGDDGSGVQTITDTATIVPNGNCTNFVFTPTYPVAGTSVVTIVSYVNPLGNTVLADWQQPGGTYAVIAPDGTKMLAVFTYGSASVSFLQPLVTLPVGTYNINILDPSVTNYRPYISKVDGNLYYCNGRYLGRILAQNNNTSFNPASPATYVVSYGATAILQPDDTIVDMTDLKGQLIIAGQKDLYPWDYVSPNVNASTPVGEQIFTILNLLNNIYILSGQKGNIYVSNGYSAQLLYKIPDYIAGIIDPVWSWGGIMVHRSRLYFQVFASTTGGTNILAGVFSLLVSPGLLGETAAGLVMEAQNAAGLTPPAGSKANALLIDNSPSSNGRDSYYSVYSNSSTTGLIDYNDTSLWQNFEPTIETDIIPVGDFLDKNSFGNIEFKLDRPMATGDQIRMYFRTSLTDSYTLMGTTTTATLSDYYQSNIFQAQWVQFMIQFKCASSGSSFIPLREVRLHFN